MTDPTTERAEFTEDLERRITGLVRDFQDLELEQMRKGEIEARAKLANVKEQVDEKRSDALASLSRARKASASAWDEAKGGLQSAWTELRGAVDRARDELAGEAQGDTA